MSSVPLTRLPDARCSLLPTTTVLRTINFRLPPLPPPQNQVIAPQVVPVLPNPAPPQAVEGGGFLPALDGDQVGGSPLLKSLYGITLVNGAVPEGTELWAGLGSMLAFISGLYIVV